MGYTVKIDPDSCISSGTCVADAPEAFGFDEEDIATPLPGATELPDERLLRIARNCPAGPFCSPTPRATRSTCSPEGTR